MAEALQEVGLLLDPSLETLGPDDTVRLHQRGETIQEVDDCPPTHSDRLPNQIITWDASNMGDADGTGEWLRCLKSTQPGDRQFVWEGSSPILAGQRQSKTGTLPGSASTPYPRPSGLPYARPPSHG